MSNGKMKTVRNKILDIVVENIARIIRLTVFNSSNIFNRDIFYVFDKNVIYIYQPMETYIKTH